MTFAVGAALHLLAVTLSGFSLAGLPAGLIALYRLGRKRRLWLDLCAIALLLAATLGLLSLDSMARGTGPDRSLFALGYAGWGPGQLESEIHDNAWLHAPFDEDLVFDRDADTKWERALKSIGVDLFTLSGAAGRA